MILMWMFLATVLIGIGKLVVAVHYSVQKNKESKDN